MSEEKTTAKERCDARTAVYVSLKLNKGTDADILRAIDGHPKQTEIKRLIRQGTKYDLPPQQDHFHQTSRCLYEVETAGIFYEKR